MKILMEHRYFGQAQRTFLMGIRRVRARAGNSEPPRGALTARWPITAGGVLVWLGMTFFACADTPVVPTASLGDLAELRGQAAKQDPVAQRSLGLKLIDRAKNAEMSAEGLDWLKKSASQKDALAEYALGMVYDDGKIVARDPAEAFTWFKAAADQNVREAQYNTAVCYRKGEGVPASDELAFEYFRKAAERGHPEAQEFLGLAFRDGKGVAKDPAQAVAWLRQAADKNQAEAQFYLGLLLKNGLEKTNAPEESMEWIRRAAENGYGDAQYALGLAYMTGDSVNKDSTNAIQWWETAARQNHGWAAYALSQAYMNGVDVPRDMTKGLSWLKRAAEAGQADAQQLLGTNNLLAGISATAPEPQTKRTWVRAAAQDEAPPRLVPPAAPPQIGSPILVGLMGLTGFGSLLMAAACLAGLLLFRRRVEGLETQLRLAREEVAGTNQHLGLLLAHLEKVTRSIESAPRVLPPAPPAPQLVDSKEATQSFRVERQRPKT